MIRIGWLVDEPKSYQGGAELDAATLAEAAPDWAEVIPCPPDDIATEVDAYVVHNCVQYDRAIIPLLERKPVIKRVHDLWPHGDTVLRRWLLENAELLIFSSPLHREVFRWRVSAPVAYLPSAINADRFDDPIPSNGQRSGNLWLGRLAPGKGLEAVRRWAQAQDVTVDVYGAGPLECDVQPPLIYCGKVDYGHVPALLARYETLIFLPEAVEPFCRTVVEASLAHCHLIVNGNIGALWWMQHNPSALREGARLFWELVRHEVET